MVGLEQLMLAVAAAVVAGMGFYIPLAKRCGWVAHVLARSSHQRVTAVGGGIVMAVVLLAVLVIAVVQGWLPDYWLWFGVGAGVLSILGWLDDRRDLPVRLRLMGQCVVLSVWACLIVDTAAVMPWALLLVGVFAQLWFINLFNFMDGLDGFAALEALFVLAVLVWLHWPMGDVGIVYCLGLAAVAGFLVWNWPPAKVFMGDAGSLMLGFWLSAPLWLEGWGHLSVWLIVTAAFNVDASLTLLARWQRGEALAQAHRTHLYQRLARYWGGHRPVLLALVLVNGLWLLPWAWFAHARMDWAWASVAAAYFGLGLCWWRFRDLASA